MNEEAWKKFRSSRKPIPKKKNFYGSDEQRREEGLVEDLLQSLKREDVSDRGFRVIKLEPPQGGLSYMKRSKYLNDPEYSDLPQFIDARGSENGVSIFESSLDGGTFIKELPVGEFDKVYEID